MPLRPRQFICRSLFLLLGMVPLMGTVGFATWQRVALDGDACQLWIAGRLGLDARIPEVVRPRPGTIRCERPQLIDPENGALVAQCDVATVTRSDRIVGVHIPTLTISPGQFSRLVELLHNQLLCQRKWLSQPVFLVVDEVRIQEPTGSIALSGLRFEAELGPNGPLANVRFRWADQPDSDPFRLQLARDQVRTPATTHVIMESGDAIETAEIHALRPPASHALIQRLSQ